MKRSLRALVALALAAAALPVAGCPKSHSTTGPSALGEVTLPLAPRKVGIRWTKTDDTTTDLEITAGDQKVKVGGSRHHVTAYEILAVDDAGVASKLAITYRERETHNVGPGAADAPSPLAGKSYVVWREDGALRATTEAGAAVSDEELAELTEDQDDLGKPPVLEQILARTWKVGERVELTADELARLTENQGGAMRTTAASITLTGVTGDDADFALTMKMEDSASNLTIDATGRTVIDVRTGRPRRSELAGPVTGSAAAGDPDGPPGGFPVTGAMKSVVVYEFAN